MGRTSPVAQVPVVLAKGVVVEFPAVLFRLALQPDSTLCLWCTVNWSCNFEFLPLFHLYCSVETSSLK